MSSEQGWLRQSRVVRIVLGWIVVGSACSAALAGECKFTRLAELPITMNGMRPTIAAKINGHDANFLVDSGAFYSVISRATADRFGLRLGPAPPGFYMVGIGGRVEAQIATVKEFNIADIPARNVEFLVGGGEVQGGSVGLIGQNLLAHFDVEYDFAHGALRLFRADGCGKRLLAYWVGPGQAYSTMPIEWPTPQNPHTVGFGFLNGKRIEITFDTGADLSVLSRRAAARAGVRPDSPGVVDAGVSFGLGSAAAKSFLGTFDSFKVGDDEEVKNARVRFIDADLPNTDMLLGADFFLSHRILVANSQHRLYVTYNGGPVFDLRPRPGAATTAGIGPSQPAAAAAASAATEPSSAPASTAAGSGDEPIDAAGFARRGAAELGRNDLAAAIADLTRACELDPAASEYRYRRGIAYWRKGEGDHAKEDFDRALSLEPKLLPALMARARFALGRGDTAAAAADLATAEDTVPRQADERLALAELDLGAARPAAAVADLDDWIAEHRTDGRLPGALLQRCRARALAGIDLDGAVADCNAASRHASNEPLLRRAALESRGLVRLRQGRVADARKDFDTALHDTALQNGDGPSTWALYGRGVAELRAGDSAAGWADVAAAQKRWPPVAARFKAMGLAPDGQPPAAAESPASADSPPSP